MRKHQFDHESVEDLADPVQHHLMHHHPFNNQYYPYYLYPNDFYGAFYRNLLKRDLKDPDTALLSLLEKNSMIKDLFKGKYSKGIKSGF